MLTWQDGTRHDG